MIRGQGTGPVGDTSVRNRLQGVNWPSWVHATSSLALDNVSRMMSASGS